MPCPGLRCLFGLCLLAAMALPARSQVAITNHSRRPWRVTSAGQNLLRPERQDRLCFQTLLLGSEAPQAQTHEDGLDVTIPAHATLTLQVVDSATRAVPEVDILVPLRLLDEAERSPGFGPQLTYLVDRAREPVLPRLGYVSPLDGGGADPVAKSIEQTILAIVEDSWDPVIQERARHRGCLRRLLRLW